MNTHKTSASFSICKIAKLVFAKIAFVSMAMLFAPSTFATESDYDNFQECLDVNTFLPQYLTFTWDLFTHDLKDLNNEWTLDQTQVKGYPAPIYNYLPKDNNRLTTFALVSIKIITKPYAKTGGVNMPIIEKISCEYKDPNVNGSLFLNLQQSGRISVGETSLGKDSENNVVTDRTVAYVSRGGVIKSKDQWQYDKNAPFVTEFTCKINESKTWDSQCGGWNMNRKVQTNGFWTNAFANCWTGPFWDRCFFKGLLWSYTKDLLAARNETNNPSTKYCKDAQCTAEIVAVNNIIGKYPDGREGMAWYTRRCWAEPTTGNLTVINWKNKQWDKRYLDCADKTNPVNPWPDYSHLVGK